MDQDRARCVHLDGVRCAMSHACTLTPLPVRSHSVARFAGSYFSVPQIGEYHSSNVNHMKDAIASIPAYIERCSHCAPPALRARLRARRATTVCACPLRSSGCRSNGAASRPARSDVRLRDVARARLVPPRALGAAPGALLQPAGHHRQGRRRRTVHDRMPGCHRATARLW